MAHDSTLAEYCHLVMGSDGIPGAEVEWKPHVSAWPRRTRDAEADVGFYRLPGMRDTYVDGVISYADPATYPGCESTPGHVAELKKKKRSVTSIASIRYLTRATGARYRLTLWLSALSATAGGRRRPSLSPGSWPVAVRSPRVWSPQTRSAVGTL